MLLIEAVVPGQASETKLAVRVDVFRLPRERERDNESDVCLAVLTSPCDFKHFFDNVSKCATAYKSHIVMSC